MLIRYGIHTHESALVADTRSHSRVMSHDGGEHKSRKSEAATSDKKRKEAIGRLSEEPAG